MVRVFEAFAGYGSTCFALKNLGLNYELVGFSEIDKFAIQCFEQNHEGGENYGNITKINWEQVPDFDLLTGGFPCSPKGTLVKTIEGYKKIEDIIPSDLVLTHNNKYCVVNKIMSRMSNHLNYINAVGCNNLALTDEHPMYVFKNNKIKWVPVKELKKGDYISYNINNKSNNIFNITKKEAWLLGRYTADGYLDKDRNRIIFCIGKNKIKEFDKYIKKYNPWVSHKLRPAPEFIIKNDRVFSFCEDIGCGAKNKEIPHYILDLPKNILQSFLDGYIAGDGHIDTNGRFRIMFSTVSEKLYYGLQDIFIKLYKKVPSLYIREDIRKKEFSNTYNGQLCLNTRDSFIKENKIFCKIKNINRVNTNVRVYNFEVKDDNSYTLNNIIVHNCQDVSNAGKQDLSKGRSVLGFELTKVLKEKQPKYFMFENVKGLLSKKFKPFLDELLKQWEEAGYNIQYKKLNTKDFGIPQNRERIFFIGIRKDISQDFEFPKGFELKLKLKDLLEDKVDDKYYLNQKQIDSILNSSFNSRRALVQKKDICSCLAARDYKEPKCLMLDVSQIKREGKPRVYEDVGRTLNTAQGGGHTPLIINPYNGKQSYEETGTIGTSVGSTTGKTAQLVWNQTPRKITPKECFRLQGFLRDQINLDGLSDTQRYKLAGNGQSINVVELLLKELLKNEV